MLTINRSISFCMLSVVISISLSCETNRASGSDQEATRLGVLNNGEAYCPTFSKGSAREYSLRISAPKLKLLSLEYATETKSVSSSVLGPRIIDGKNTTVFKLEYPEGVAFSFGVHDSTGCYGIARQSPSNDNPVVHEPDYSIKFPVRVGGSWSQQYETQFQNYISMSVLGVRIPNASRSISVPLRLKIESLVEIITVPAGTFANCARVVGNGSFIQDNVELKVETQLWIAPGVGQVRFRSKEFGVMGGGGETPKLLYGLTVDLVSFKNE